MGASGQVDRSLDSRSEGLGFDSQCWPCVKVSGKLCIPHCLGPLPGEVKSEEHCVVIWISELQIDTFTFYLLNLSLAYIKQ